MNSALPSKTFVRGLCIAVITACVCPFALVPLTAQGTVQKATAAPASSSLVRPQRFDSPKQAADALISAAEKFDEAALLQVFGSEGEDIVFSGEVAQDRELAAEFVAEAHEKTS